MMYDIEFSISGLYSVDGIEADTLEEAVESAKEIVSMADFGTLWNIDIENIEVTEYEL